MKKHLRTILLISISILLVFGFLFYQHSGQVENCERGMNGKCLPAGKCVAPNDAVVSCKALKQNPSKTDW